MLRSLKEIIGYNLLTTDDLAGHCEDFLLDTALRRVCYTIVDTGSWLQRRRTVISTTRLGQPDWSTERIPTSFSRRDIEQAPESGASTIASHQYEISNHEYDTLPFYWPGVDFTEGTPDRRGVILPVEDIDLDNDITEPNYIPDKRHATNLTSALSILKYDAIAQDGNIGHVDDIIVDDEKWDIVNIIIDTGKILPDRQVAINPALVRKINSTTHFLDMGISHDAIDKLPNFDPDAMINRQPEIHLYDYHGKPRQWERRID